mgnify:CR=1 FL=1
MSERKDIFHLILQSDVEGVKKLIDEDKTVLNQVSEYEKVTPLFYVIAQIETAPKEVIDKLIMIAKYIISNSTSNQLKFVDNEGTSVLQIALYIGNEEIINLLLEKNVIVTPDDITIASRLEHISSDIINKMRNSMRFQLVSKRRYDRSVHPVYSKFKKGGRKTRRKRKSHKNKKLYKKRKSHKKRKN